MRRARRGLTVYVPVVPQALHLPVRQNLEVVAAVHAVQLRQPPVVSGEVAFRSLELESSRVSIRHHAPQPRNQPGILGVSAGQNRAVSPCSGQVSHVLVSGHGEAQDGADARSRLLLSIMGVTSPKGPLLGNLNIPGI